MKKLKTLISIVGILVLTATFTACGEKALDIAATEPHITASDYSDMGNWMLIPKKTDKATDVFYLYPTAWSMKKGDEPICNIDDKSMRKRARYVALGQATAFETAGNIYAPYYRQADASYLLSMSPKRQAECLAGVPGADVLAAFDYYIKHFNKGRPFILAGHSQGASMTKILIFQYMKEHPDIADRMIVSYVIGYSITKDELRANPHVKFAEGPDDVGVVISYNTEAPSIEGSNHTVLDGSIAINPISWTRTENVAGKEKNLGSYIPQENGKYKRVKGLADAAVDLDRGTVVCTTVKPEDYASSNKKFFPLGVYHSKDYGFYYYNLRQNAENRVSKYFERK